jgi:hypothetical protein
VDVYTFHRRAGIRPGAHRLRPIAGHPRPARRRPQVDFAAGEPGPGADPRAGRGEVRAGGVSRDCPGGRRRRDAYRCFLSGSVRSPSRSAPAARPHPRPATAPGDAAHGARSTAGSEARHPRCLSGKPRAARAGRS